MRTLGKLEVEDNIGIISFEYKNAFQHLSNGIARGMLFAEMGLSSETDLDKFNNLHMRTDRKDGIHLHMFGWSKKQEELDEIRSNFEPWIINCGLRQILESFHEYIDEVIWHLKLQENFDAKTFSESDLTSFSKEFRKKRKSLKFTDKLQLLTKTYKVKIPKHMYDALYSLQSIRNCLCHNSGIITHEYFQSSKNKKASVIWLAYRGYARGKASGNKVKLKVGMRTKEESTVTLEVVQHKQEKEFGEYLSFSLDELKEIAFSLFQVASTIDASVIDVVSKE